MPKEGKVVVSGINVHARHAKPSQASPQGGIDPRRGAAARVECRARGSQDGQAHRVRFEERDGKKVRVAVRSGELING